MAPSTAVIILNWKRPQNIGRIVRTASEALPAATIFVIDHGEGRDRLTGRDDIPFDLCWLRIRPNAGPGVRFSLAAGWPFEHYLCLDDDIFLTAEQIRALMARLEEQPESAHGVVGHLLTRYSGNETRMEFGVTRAGEISILNQVYAFSRKRAQATLKLAAVTGYRRWQDVVQTDDILLSCAGSSRIHDLGSLATCGTSSADDIAMHRAPGFQDERLAFLARLIERGSMYLAQSRERLDPSNLVRLV
jgi:hypothetical protein